MVLEQGGATGSRVEEWLWNVSRKVADGAKDKYERSSQVGDYMNMQTEIDEAIRMGLVGCLLQFHIKLKLTTEVIFLAVHILDQYLSVNLVAGKEFPLVGLTALVLAGKYEEDSGIPVGDYVNVAEGVYSKKQILDMEKLILRKLGWTLAIPTTYHFLVRFIKAAEADKEMENTIIYFAKSGLMQ
ncbi:cyclin-B1-2-like [Papaver somniferum]|nr:cyclin-B1-2-like [Papaver somniferum]